jgi:hypothetical protein
MPDLIRNERLKLFATWTTQMATAVLTAGVFAPLAARIYGIGGEPAHRDLLDTLPYVCICGAVVLHFIGQLALEWLDDSEDEPPDE